ncbi:MAG: RnfABCDGE type electron transport complex subunit D [Clostridia bacterium]|nr:RnfABCDGE type electron transport complex subunit D [Clostridia bacterium]
MKKFAHPFIHSAETRTDIAIDFMLALIPVLIWSVYIFGARVITLCLLGGVFSIGFDYLFQHFALKRTKDASVDVMSVNYGILACFSMPVSAPLWLPLISSALVVFAKNLRVYRQKRLFNPYIFSAAVLNIAFPKLMTAFTKPFAYFSAFDISIDSRLLNGYLVRSPLMYIADGSVYEDGAVPQLFGYASGALGEIAILAMCLSLCWLLYKKQADLTASATFVFTLLILSLMFPSADAESAYFAYSIVLSGAIGFIAVFALNESQTVPITSLGRLAFALVCGALVFASRKFFGGYEWGYLIILLMNAISPFIEEFTVQKPYNAIKNRKKE